VSLVNLKQVKILTTLILVGLAVGLLPVVFWLIFCGSPIALCFGNIVCSWFALSLSASLDEELGSLKLDFVFIVRLRLDQSYKRLKEAV